MWMTTDSEVAAAHEIAAAVGVGRLPIVASEGRIRPSHPASAPSVDDSNLQRAAEGGAPHPAAAEPYRNLLLVEARTEQEKRRAYEYNCHRRRFA